MTVERIAQNLNDGTRYGLVDNNGNRLQDQRTAPGGTVAYYSTLPISSRLDSPSRSTGGGGPRPKPGDAKHAGRDIRQPKQGRMLPFVRLAVKPLPEGAQVFEGNVTAAKE